MSQSRNWAVEWTLVVMLAIAEDGHLVEVFGEPGALSGMKTNPLSIIAVCACIRMIFSQSGW